MRPWSPILACWCLGGCPAPADPVDTADTDHTDDTEAQVEVAVSPTSPRLHLDDLVCTATGAPAEAVVSWRGDGSAWDGDVATTAVPGDTVPASSLSAASVWTCVWTWPGGEATAETRTHRSPIVLFLTDDLGHRDLGVQGSPDAVTPRLDALAAQGVRFTDAYASAPVCSPSRAGLFTGQQQNRYGFEYNLGPDGPTTDRGLPANRPTLAELLRDESGYVSGLFGKWHLGYQPDLQPNARGFATFYGFLGGRRPSVDPARTDVLTIDLREDDLDQWDTGLLGPKLQRNGVREPVDGRHLTDAIADEAITFIRAHKDEPFLAVVSFHAPHTPIQAPPEHVALVPDPPSDLERLAYLATVAGMDAAAGRILDVLDEEGLADDTLVIFTSDNGCVSGRLDCENQPFRGGKLSMEEGGIRVPLLVRWPGRLEPGTVVDGMASLLDVVPTVATAAAVPARAWPEGLDGVDLTAAVREERPPHQRLDWQLFPVRAIRLGPAKLVQAYERFWLFDVVEDPGETTDLVDERGEVARRLDGLVRTRAQLYRPPRWTGQVYEGFLYGEALPLAY